MILGVVNLHGSHGGSKFYNEESNNVYIDALWKKYYNLFV
jgi:hypothetical protein